MHIVAIGWMYVVSMMSVAEESAAAGLMTFFGYGVAPLALVLYLAGTRGRKRRIKAKQEADQAERLRRKSGDE